MLSNNDPNTQELLQPIRELARFSADIADSVYDIHGELIRLREQLGIEESKIKKQLVARPYRARSTKPN